MDSVVDIVDFDRQLNQIDRIYSRFGHACGLSDCAFWMLLDTAAAGGEAAISYLTDQWYYSKQTIASALKSLTQKELVTLEFVEGSRKSKRVCLTSAGTAFAERYTAPAIEAERRAFETFDEKERGELMRLLGKFSVSLEHELEAYEKEVAR